MQHTCAYLSTYQSPVDPAERSLLRTVMNGTFYTADHLPKRDANLSGACPFCGEDDSVLNRNWHCPALEVARQTCSMPMKTRILAQHPAFYNHGWISTPNALAHFRAQLDDIPAPQLEPGPHHDLPGFLDLFTDGSCLGPRNHLSRLASWRLVAATLQGDSDFRPIAAGLLPGRSQTITRAELLAAVVAIRFAITQNRPYRLWVDNQFVVKRIRAFMSHPMSKVHVNKPNHDLLQQLQDVLQTAGMNFRGVIKVYSHQDSQQVTDPVERWAFQGNQAADELAAFEFNNHSLIMNCRRTLINEIQELDSMRHAAHTVFLAVGKLILSQQSKQYSIAPTEDPRKDLQLEPLSMTSWEFPAELPEEAAHYNIDDWPCIAEWVFSMHSGTGQVRYWSWFQLYADFQMIFPDKGPWFNLKQLRWESKATMPSEIFVRRTRWFTTFLMNLAKQLGFQMPMAYRLPHSHVIHYWLNTVPVQVHEARGLAADRWLQGWRQIFTHSKQLRRIA